MIDGNLHWLLSFYRTSEIGGALFFGQLAQRLHPGSTQHNMTRHFAEEAQHARFWSDCIAGLGAEPLRLEGAYQDRYLATAGLPANLMEILAITHVFEQRVFRHYLAHARLPDTPGPVASTLARIITDEKWHIEWIGQALRGMEVEYGSDTIQSTLSRYRAADRQVYRALLHEHADRARALGIGSCGVGA